MWWNIVFIVIEKSILENVNIKVKTMIKEEVENSIVEVQKSQNIRLVDVFVIAPICVYAGTQKSLPTWLRYSLIGIGVATAYYNGKNYLENKNRLLVKK